MARPFLLIGVGTGGLKVLENVQRFYYEMIGENKPKNVEYLYLETDDSAQPEVTAKKNEIERVSLDIKQRNTLIEGLKKIEDIDSSWIPNAGLVAEAGSGANGFSAFGRVALWGGGNLQKFIASVQVSYGKLRSHINSPNEGNPIVYIVGAFTGGTGSGIFIDVAYVLQTYLNTQNVHGLFLVPTSTDDKGNYNKEIRNTLTSLRALDFVNKKENLKYSIRLPNREEINSQFTPFELVQIISREYHNQGVAYPDIQSIEGLQKIAGLHVFLNTLSLHNERARILSNAFSGDISNYTTFGLSAIQYPKSQLEEFVALNLGEDLLKRWKSTTNFYENSQFYEIKGASATKKSKASEKFESLLNEAFALLDGIEVPGGKKILSDIKTKAEELNEGESKHGEKSDYDFINKLFSSRISGQYYQVLRDNISNAVNFLIEGIHDLIASNLDSHESLNLAKIELDGIIDGIQRCILYWRDQLKLSGDPNKWEATLDKQTNWIIENKYTFLGEQNNVVADRMKTTLDMLKIHLIANVLVDIQIAINKGVTTDGRVLKSSSRVPKELPTKVMIDNLISHISTFLESKSDFTFNSRIARLRNDIDDNTLPIWRIYNNTDFYTEVESIRKDYERQKGKIPSKKSITKDTLWEYLNKHPSKADLQKKLYSDTITIFATELRLSECVKDMDLVTHLEKNETGYEIIAKKALSPLLRINRNNSSRFGESNNLPRLVISGDENTVTKVLNKFRERNFPTYDATGRAKLVDAQLKNIIIFYVERGKIEDGVDRPLEPLKDIYYIPDAIDIYNAHINNEDVDRSKNINREQKLKIANPYRFPNPVLEEEIKKDNKK